MQTCLHPLNMCKLVIGIIFNEYNLQCVTFSKTLQLKAFHFSVQVREKGKVEFTYVVPLASYSRNAL